MLVGNKAGVGLTQSTLLNSQLKEQVQNVRMPSLGMENLTNEGRLLLKHQLCSPFPV